MAFVRHRLNGEDGFGAIYPSIAYTLMMFKIMDVPEDHPDMIAARAAFAKLMADNGEEGFCQPCLSPIWDTVLSAHALMEALPETSRPAEQALDWLIPHQVLDLKGDWAYRRPQLRPGGWAFQYSNTFYVDLDDTAVVVMAMDRARTETGTDRYDEAIDRGREWVAGMQSSNGGWAAYDVDNTSYYLNHIPFADHGALLDPPTSDVTARCVSMLGQLGDRLETSEAVRRGIAFLLAEQHAEGSWFGRWGLNYVYGTWSVLCALNAVGIDRRHPAVRRAIAWLKTIQNQDGGWGEDDAGYAVDYTGYKPCESTASQTAWALLGLMAAGEVDSEAVRRGIAYLEASQSADGFWDEVRYYGCRVSAGLLPALRRLSQVLPAVGLGPLPQPPEGRAGLRDPGHVARARHDPHLPGFTLKAVSWNPARQGDPYAYYAKLRRETPVVRAKIPTRGPGWMVTRYADAVQVMRDPRFSNDPRQAATPPLFGFGGRFAPKLIKLVGDSMICADNPAHGRLRKLVAKAFTPKSVAEMEGSIETIVETMLDAAAARCAEQGRIDLMSELALPLPLTVISEMLGIPEAWRLSFHHQITRLIEVNDQPVKRAIRWLPAMPKLVRFFEKLIDLKRVEPDDRLISRLMAAEDPGRHAEPRRARRDDLPVAVRRPRDVDQPHRQRRARPARPPGADGAAAQPAGADGRSHRGAAALHESGRIRHRALRHGGGVARRRDDPEGRSRDGADRLRQP